MDRMQLFGWYGHLWSASHQGHHPETVARARPGIGRSLSVVEGLYHKRICKDPHISQCTHDHMVVLYNKALCKECLHVETYICKQMSFHSRAISLTGDTCKHMDVRTVIVRHTLHGNLRQAAPSQRVHESWSQSDGFGKQWETRSLYRDVSAVGDDR